MTNWNKHLEISHALDNLKAKYPKLFTTNLPLEGNVPEDDPDYMMIKSIRRKMAYNDLMKLQTEKFRKQVMLYLQEKPDLNYVIRQMGVDRQTLVNYIQDDKELREFWQRQKQGYAKVKVLDSKVDKVYTFPSVGVAAEFIGIPKQNLTYRLLKRHKPAVIKERYQAKRKIWYDVDQSMN